MNVPGNARFALTVFLGLLVSSCGEVLPRFDNPLNPEIRSLRAVEVVDGVRCAVTSFLRERYDEMTTAALEKAERARCQVTHLKWNFRVMTLDQKPGSPTEGKCIIANNIEDADPINCNPVYHAWTYERYKKRDAKDDSVQLTSARNCVPNGGCVPGTVPKGNDTCTLEDDSRFALDPNSSATIELNLTANNSGSMAYTRLDAEHLGWLKDTSRQAIHLLELRSQV